MSPLRTEPSSPVGTVAAGVGLALCGVALFTPVFAAAKFSVIAVPALSIMAMRYLGGLMTVLAILPARGRGAPSIRATQIWPHLLRACLGAGGGAAAIHAASLLPVADAAAIGLTKGMLTVALAALILRERVTSRHWLAGGLCALGAWFVLRAATGEAVAGAETARNLEGALAAFASALFIALEALMIKVLARRVNATTMLLYVNAFGALLLIGPGLWALEASAAGWADMFWFLWLGPVAIAGQYCNILAYRRADAAVLGPVGYSWILFSTALGYVWFGEVPGPGAALGAAMIAAGGVWLSAPHRPASRRSADARRSVGPPSATTPTAGLEKPEAHACSARP